MAVVCLGVCCSGTEHEVEQSCYRRKGRVTDYRFLCSPTSLSDQQTLYDDLNQLESTTLYHVPSNMSSLLELMQISDIVLMEGEVRLKRKLEFGETSKTTQLRRYVY